MRTMFAIDDDTEVFSTSILSILSWGFFRLRLFLPRTGSIFLCACLPLEIRPDRDYPELALSFFGLF